MSSHCQGCTAVLQAGDEICPRCLKTQVTVGSRFTRDVVSETSLNPTVSSHSQINLPSLPDSFSPSSPIYRIYHNLRGGLLSAAVALCFMVLGGFWWVHSHRSQGSESQQIAEAHFESGHYERAISSWEDAFDAYQQGLDKTGQVQALLGLSRCHIRAKNFSEALAALQHAQKVQPDESLELAIKKCYRMSAAQHLANAQDLFYPNSFSKAFLEAELAIEGFKMGEASKQQLAGAYRMAARCSLKLDEFERSETYLNQARESEGDTQANRTLANDLQKAAIASRSRAVANNEGYIPKSKIDSAAIERAATKYAGRSSNENSYSAYQPYRRTSWSTTSTLGSSQLRSPRRVRTSVGGSSSYPTARTPEPEYGDQDYYRSSVPLQTYSPPVPYHPKSAPAASSRQSIGRTYPKPSTHSYPKQRPTRAQSSYRSPVQFRSP